VIEKWPAPDGFVVERRGRSALVADPGWIEELRRARLDRPERWVELLAAAPGSPGRGRTSTVRLPEGRSLRLKRLRRGGLAGPLWRDRMVGRRRLVDNLRLPAEVVRRRVATPLAPALLILGGPPGLYRGWLAVEEIPGAVDLASRFGGSAPPSREEMAAVMKFVRRIHDAGLDHRDLNLGNLLIRGEGPEAEVFVVDLDGARLHDGPLAYRPRQRALRRLERSYVKVCRASPDDERRREIYEHYAGEDAGLAARLERGFPAGRFWIRLHALGWRR